MAEKPKRSGIAAVAREPLAHFLILGGLAFALYGYVSGGDDAWEAPDRVIEIGGDRIRSLREMWLKKWQRPPVEKELRGVIESIVREEILSREAIALGLDRDDPIVRRRLAQKMDFLAKDLAPSPTPTEEELRAFLESEAKRYERPARVSFTQVFFSPDRRGETAPADARAELERLRADPDRSTDEIGDSAMLPAALELASGRQITGRFGAEFAADVLALPTGEWRGPIGSAYGLHLVRVTDRREAQTPELDEVREEVLRDLMVKRREQANLAFYDALRSLYRVSIDEAALKAVVLPARDSR